MRNIIFKDNAQFGVWKYLDEVNSVVTTQYACAQPIEMGIQLGEPKDNIEDVGYCATNLALLLLTVNFPDAVSNTVTSAPDGVVYVLGNNVNSNLNYDHPENAFGLGALWAIRFEYIDDIDPNKNFVETKMGRVSLDNIPDGWRVASDIDSINMNKGTLYCTFVLSFDEETPPQTVQNLHELVSREFVIAPESYGDDNPFGEHIAYFGHKSQVAIDLQGCHPTSLDINYVTFTGNKSIQYSVNGDEFRTISCDFDTVIGPKDIRIFLSMINTEAIQTLFKVNYGSAETTAFFLSYSPLNTDNTLIGHNENGTSPTSIVLRDLSGGVIQAIFGLNTITLHSCGFEYYPGI